MRHETFLDVAVEVPESWGYDYAPSTAWCIDEEIPDSPFVDLSVLGYFTPAILCDGGVNGRADFTGTGAPPRHWTTYMTFWVSGRRDSIKRFDGWTRVRKTIGSTQLTLFYDEKHAEEAEAILDSARRISVDHHGCTVRSPIQQGGFVRPSEPFDIAAIEEVESITVCQYALGAPPRRPGLMASRRLDGGKADAVLTAIKAAPVGGGPDEPQNCGSDDSGESAVVLRLEQATAMSEMYVYYSTCRGNGFDDGTNLRELTTAACRPLFDTPPVLHTSGSEKPYRRCVDLEAGQPGD